MLTIVITLALTLASTFAGTWKHEVVANDGDVLTYSDEGKLKFHLGCGRCFALHVKYPGAAKKDGILDSNGPITISAGKLSYRLPPIEAGAWHKGLESCRN